MNNCIFEVYYNDNTHGQFIICNSSTLQHRTAQIISTKYCNFSLDAKAYKLLEKYNKDKTCDFIEECIKPELLEYITNIRLWTTQIYQAKCRTSPFDYMRNGRSRNHNSNILRFFESTLNAYTKQLIENCELISFNESRYIESTFNGGLAKFHGEKNGVYDILTYDFKMSYPHIMAEKLCMFKDVESFEMPTRQPQYLSDYEFKMKKSDPSIYLGLPFGIYKATITSKLKSFNNWFAFNHKTNMYTHYELNFLMENYKELKLTITNLYDCIIYDELVAGKTLFNQWFHRSLELKNELKGNLLVKKLSSSVWGHLSEKNTKWYTEQELESNEKIEVSAIYNDMEEHHTHYLLDEKIKSDESVIYKLQSLKQPYKHQYRLKPWITSLQRVQLYKIIMHMKFATVARYHTDSVSFYNELLTDKDKEKLNNISATFVYEEKTSGMLYYDAGRFHRDVD